MKDSIAIIIRALDHGGAERAASNMSIEMCANYHVHLILFDAREQMYPYGGELHDLNLYTDGKNPVTKALNLRKRICRIRKIEKENHIKCTVSLLDNANIANVLSGKKCRRIVSIRDVSSTTKKSFLSKKKLSLYCRKADKVVVLSHRVGQDLIDHFGVDPSKIVTVYNSVDAERLEKLATEPCGYDFPFIVTAGRMIMEKGHANLLRAFRIAAEKHPELKLVILGQGTYEEQLKALTKKLGLENNVVFPGYIKNPHSIMKKSRFFVFSSISEGLGNVILEAMACGKAVLSTDCIAGPREILAPDSDLELTTKGIHKAEYAAYGVLVPASKIIPPDFERTECDEPERIMGETMNELLERPEVIEHYEKQSKLRVRDFSAENINRCWAEVIEDVCAGK